MNQGQTATEKALVNGVAGGFQQSSITLGGGRGTLGGVTTIAPKSSNQEARPPPSSQIHHQEKGPQDSTQQQQEQPHPQTPPMESEMDGEDKFLKRTYKSEYRKKFRPFSQYQYVDGKFHKSKAEGESPNAWYKEVLELRKQAGQYRCRGWGVETASDRMAEIYTKQVELWEQVSRRSSLQALSLASAAPSRPISKAEKEIENSRRSSPIKHARDRPSTAPSKQKPAPVHKPADKIDGKAQKESSTPRHHYEKTTGATDGFIITSPTRDRIEPIPSSDWSTRRSPRKTPPITSPLKDGIAQKRRPPRAISVARTSTAKDKVPPPPSNKSSVSLAARSVSVGPENRSPKRASRPPTGTHAQTPSTKTERRPRPTSLTTSSRRKGADSAIPHHEAKKPTKKPHDISASPKRATDLKSRDERRQSSEDDKKDKEKDGKEVIKDALKDTVGRKSTPEPRFDPEKYEPVVKTPPEPTRVKSPDQVMVKSPDPVNWTVPLDTGKTFTVTSNVPEGEASRGTPSSEHRPPLESRSRQTPEPTKVYQGSLAGTPITTAGTVSSASSAPTSTSTAASSHLPSKTDSATTVKTSTPSTTASATSTISATSVNVPAEKEKEKEKEPVSGSSGTSILSSSDTVPVDEKISKTPSDISISTASKPIDSKLSSIKETSPQPTDSSKPYQELPKPSEVVETNISPSASIPSSVGLPSGTFEVVGSDSTNNYEFSDSLFQGAPINTSLLTVNEKKDFGESNLFAGKFEDNMEDLSEGIKDITHKTFEEDSEFYPTGNKYEFRDNEPEYNTENIKSNVDFNSETKSIASSLEENPSDHEGQSFEIDCKDNNDDNTSDLEKRCISLEKGSNNDLTENLKDSSLSEETNLLDVPLNFKSSTTSLKYEQDLQSDDEHELKEDSSQETHETSQHDKLESDNLTEHYKNNETFEENVSFNSDELENTDNSSFSKFNMSKNETSLHDYVKPENYFDDKFEKDDFKIESESIGTKEEEIVKESTSTFEQEIVDDPANLTAPKHDDFKEFDDSFNKNNDISFKNEVPIVDEKIEATYFEDISSHDQRFGKEYEENLHRFESNVHEDSKIFSDELNETSVYEESLLASTKVEEESTKDFEESNIHSGENKTHIPPSGYGTLNVFDDEKPFDNNENNKGFDSLQSEFSEQEEIKRSPSEISLHSEDSSERVPFETSLQADNPLAISTPQTLMHNEYENESSHSQTSLQAEESSELQENINLDPSVNENEFLTIGSENITQQSTDTSYKDDKYDSSKQGSSSSSSSSESDNEESHIPINFEKDEQLHESQIKDNSLITASQNQESSFSSNSKIDSDIDIESRRENVFDENELLSSTRDSKSEYNNFYEEDEVLTTASNIQCTSSYEDDKTVQEYSDLKGKDDKVYLSENDSQISVEDIKASVHENDFSSNNYNEDFKPFSSNHPIESENYEFEENLSEFQGLSTGKLTSDNILLPETSENILEKTPTTHFVEEQYSNNASNPFMPADSFKTNSLLQDNQMSTDDTSFSIFSNSEIKLSNEDELKDYAVNAKSSDLFDNITNSFSVHSESVEENKGAFFPDDKFNTTHENSTNSDDESDTNSVPESALQKKRVSFSLAQNSGEESENEGDSNSVHSFNGNNGDILNNDSENERHDDDNPINADNLEAEILCSGDAAINPSLKELESENYDHLYDGSLCKDNNGTSNIETENSQILDTSVHKSNLSGLDINETDEKSHEYNFFQQHSDSISNHNISDNDYPKLDKVVDSIQEGVLPEVISNEEEKESSSEDEEDFNLKRKESFETQETPSEYLHFNTSYESSKDIKDSTHLQSESDDSDNDDKHSSSSENSQKYGELGSKDHSQMNPFSENAEGLRYDIQLQYKDNDDNEDSNSFSSEASQVQNVTNKMFNETFESTNSDEVSHINSETKEKDLFLETDKNTDFHQQFGVCESDNESDSEVRSKDVVKRLFASSNENLNKAYSQEETFSGITRLETDSPHQTFSQVSVENDDSFVVQDTSSDEILKEENLDLNRYTESNTSNNFKTENINITNQQLVFQDNYIQSDNLQDENLSMDHETNFHFDTSIDTKKVLPEEFNYQDKYSDEHSASGDSASESIKDQLLFESPEFRSEDPNLFINAELKFDQRTIDESELNHSSIQSIGYTSMQENQSYPSEYKNVKMDNNLNYNYKNEEKSSNDLTSIEAELHSPPNFEYLKSFVPNTNTNASANYFDNLNNGVHLHDHEYDSYESSESMVIKNDDSSSSNQRNINEHDFNKISTEET